MYQQETSRMDETCDSPWLDVHRRHLPPAGPRDDEAARSEDADDVGESDPETNPWDDVDASGRPSQTDVDLPSPDPVSPVDD